MMIYNTNENGLLEKIGEKKIIMYKCLICNYFTKEVDDTWTTEKKEEVKLEIDKHHDDHIVPQT